MASRFGTISMYSRPVCRSANVLRVPGTWRMPSSDTLTRSISFRSSPKTLMPTGVRTPWSTCRCASGSAARWPSGSRAAKRGVQIAELRERPRLLLGPPVAGRASQSGAMVLYQRVYRVGQSAAAAAMTDSIMSSWADRSRLPTACRAPRRSQKPHDDAVLSQRSTRFLNGDTGNVVGITSSDPSSSGGMNSDPRRWKVGTVAIMRRTAAATTTIRNRTTSTAIGR